MSYGVNGVSYLKERRVSKLQGTYNLPYYRIGRALATLRTWMYCRSEKGAVSKGVVGC